ncbi:MAG: SDR family NAD(P)-dependent oxidoreductase, partial [Lachnospiraceae bacterium]|nr:SDR family NAD(P)-dependent oxidoreductase [Lachnospiraceae bacterium]
MEKCIVVTGAYGGMGYSTVKNLSESGYTVFALDQKVRKAEPNVIPIETDVTDAGSVRRAFERVKAET